MGVMKGLALVHTGNNTACIYKRRFAEKGVEIEIMSLHQFYIGIKQGKITHPLTNYWDFVLLLCPKKYDHNGIFDMLATDGIRVFNTPSAVEKCDNKWLTYTTLQEAGVPQMATYENSEQAKENGLLDTDESKNKLLKKVVVKDLYGSFGEMVHLCSYLSDLKQVVKDLSYANKPFIIQEFCETTNNRGARVTCIGGKYVASYYKETKNGDFRVNLQKGAIGTTWEIPQAFVDLAEKTAQIIGADYCGIDFMFGENDAPIVCEVNARALFGGMERINEMDIRGLYVDYIIEQVGGAK